jgi:hypothetical protein
LVWQPVMEGIVWVDWVGGRANTRDGNGSRGKSGGVLLVSSSPQIGEGMCGAFLRKKCLGGNGGGGVLFVRGAPLVENIVVA